MTNDSISKDIVLFLDEAIERIKNGQTVEVDLLSDGWLAVTWPHRGKEAGLEIYGFECTPFTASAAETKDAINYLVQRVAELELYQYRRSVNND